MSAAAMRECFTAGGSYTHLTRDGQRTLCGRAVATASPAGTPAPQYVTCHHCSKHLPRR